MEIIPRRRSSDVSRPNVFQIFEGVHQVIRESKAGISAAQTNNDELRLLLKNEKNIRKTAEARAADFQARLDQNEDEIYWYKERVNLLESELETVSLSRDALAEYITTTITCGVVDRDCTEVIADPSPSQQEESFDKQQSSSGTSYSDTGRINTKATQFPNLASFDQEGSPATPKLVESGETLNQDHYPQTVGKSFLVSDLVKDQVVNSLLQNLQKEQEKSFALEDKILELQENIEKERKSGEEMEKNLLKEKEHLDEMLRRERQLNERISREGDCAVEELQAKLQQVTQDNLRLKQSKERWSRTVVIETHDKECQIDDNKTASNLTEVKAGHAENCVESSRQHRHDFQWVTKRHGKQGVRSNLLQPDKSAIISQCIHSNASTSSNVTNRCTQTDSSTSETVHSSPRNGSGTKLRYGNVTYRTQLSQMIRDGLHWFCTMGNRAARADQDEAV